MKPSLTFLPDKDIARIQLHLGSIRTVTSMSNGLVHWVYKIVGTKRTGYLKQRRQVFRGVLQINTKPELIKDEAKALKLFHSHFPTIFPRVMVFSRSSHFLLLSDISIGPSFEQKLNANQATLQDLHIFGSTLAQIHIRTSEITLPIRSGGDETFRDKQLEYLLGCLNLPVLNNAILAHKKLPTNLILGDPSPKNVYIHGERIGICDLENSHQGSHMFEQAHMVAHVLIHCITHPKMEKNVLAVVDGYAQVKPDINIYYPLFVKTVIGLLLYRLASPVIPYKTNLTWGLQRRVVRNLIQLLEQKGIVFDQLLLTLRAH